MLHALRDIFRCCTQAVDHVVGRRRYRRPAHSSCARAHGRAPCKYSIIIVWIDTHPPLCPRRLRLFALSYTVVACVYLVLVLALPPAAHNATAQEAAAAASSLRVWACAFPGRHARQPNSAISAARNRKIAKMEPEKINGNGLIRFSGRHCSLRFHRDALYSVAQLPWKAE